LNLAQIDKPELDALLSSLRNKGAEVAIVNTTVSGLLVPHLKEHGFSIVSLVHEMPGILNTYKLQEHAAHIAAHADKIIFPAQQVKDGFEAFIGHPLAQAVIRPQGLYLRSLLRQGADKGAVRAEVRQQLGLTEDAKIIMCAGYADHRKGFDLFVQACIQVMQKVPDTYALWVGHLYQKFVDQSLQAATHAGLRERFLFTGLVDHPQAYYLAADVYALTSREDPFPSVVMEALDALTPVVAFKGCGGFENLLKRDCGVLVPSEDHAAMAEATIDLLQNMQHAKTLAETGRDIVEAEFSFRHYLFDQLAFAGHPMPRVSVVVPNYNYARYLQDRLETVTNQTLPLYELIVLDDRSTDDSQQVIQNFLKQCDVPWRLEVNATNSGSVFRQWRKGVELARGEYVWIAEADDTCKPQFLQRVLSRMQETGAVLGFADSWQINENGKHLGDSYKSYVNEEAPGAFNQSFVMEGREFLTKHLGIKNVILNVSGVVFRRDALLAALGRVGDELFEYKVAGDWRLYIELCASNPRVVFEAEPHSRHRTSVTHALVAERHLEEIRKMHGLANKIAQEQSLFMAQNSYINDVKLSLGMS
jgi:glycosyltransferase involved in cell wall biosynthesis